jgi:hypothetical protein
VKAFFTILQMRAMGLFAAWGRNPAASHPVGPGAIFVAGATAAAGVATDSLPSSTRSFRT